MNADLLALTRVHIKKLTNRSLTVRFTGFLRQRAMGASAGNTNLDSGLNEMSWEKLLSKTRPDNPKKSGHDSHRSAFEKDIDKITFSKAFRRLGRKTQVHPLVVNDHVHNRLTHSLEVATVGRSLGRAIGHWIIEKKNAIDRNTHTADHFGSIVQAACLAHDIGNPPFGHAGENAIRQWMTENEDKLIGLNGFQSDFLLFEGNAQGFRIATCSNELQTTGGFGLTSATLGAMIKYPWYSDHYMAAEKKKFNVFKGQSSTFENLVGELGLIPSIEGNRKNDSNSIGYCRHPLAYLVEAADDICNAIIDIEDAVELMILKKNQLIDSDNRQLIDLFYALLPNTSEHKSSKLKNSKNTAANDESAEQKLSSLRAKAIGNLITECLKAFKNNYDEIMTGMPLIRKHPGDKNYDSVRTPSSLVEIIDPQLRNVLETMNLIALKEVYPYRRNTELELGCYSSLSTILDNAMSAAMDIDSDKDETPKQKNLFRLITDDIGDDIKDKNISLYQRYMLVTDFVSGMTDNHATHIAAQLSGHAR